MGLVFVQPAHICGSFYLGRMDPEYAWARIVNDVLRGFLYDTSLQINFMAWTSAPGLSPRFCRISGKLSFLGQYSVDLLRAYAIQIYWTSQCQNTAIRHLDDQIRLLFDICLNKRDISQPPKFATPNIRSA